MTKQQNNKADFWDVSAVILFLLFSMGASAVSVFKDMGDAIKQKFQHSRQR